MHLPEPSPLPQWPYAPRVHEHPDGHLHYIDEGTGPPIVLVHGTPTWSYEWRHLVPTLAASYRVLAVDHLGFGRSDRPRCMGYRPEDHAARFAHWYAAVVGDAPCDVVVHDFGGPIALPTVLARAHAIRHLIVLNSWAWDMGQDPALRRQIDLVQGPFGRVLYRYLNASLTLLMPRGYANRAKLTAAVHRQYRALFRTPADRELVLYALARSLRESGSFFNALWERRNELAQIPVHIIWGLRDGMLPPSLLAQWRAGLPHATVTELADAGHWPHEELPEAVTQAVLRALDEVPIGER